MYQIIAKAKQMKFRSCKRFFLHKITDDIGIHVCECVSIHLPLYVSSRMEFLKGWLCSMVREFWLFHFTDLEIEVFQ